MDIMKIKLSTRFMRSMASKIIARAIYKKTGFKPEIHLNEIDISMIENDIRFHINVDGRVDKKTFTKISQMIDESEEP